MDDSPIEVRVSTLLKDRNETISIVETCTGGTIATRLTDGAGASEYFTEGFIPYSYDAHRTRLGISRETLDAHGAVSAPTTRALAERARDLTDTDWGLAASGIAGPGGGSPKKPVGTAFIGVAYAGEWETNDSYSETTRTELTGNRQEIREQITENALTFLSTHLSHKDTAQST